MEAQSRSACNDIAEWTSFADAFDSQCRRLFLHHLQLNVAMEERRQRLALWDTEEDARYDLRVNAHEAFVVVLNTWKNDTAKRAYTRKLMEDYYDKVACGSTKQAEIDTRRARLEGDREA